VRHRALTPRRRIRSFLDDGAHMSILIVAFGHEENETGIWGRMCRQTSCPSKQRIDDAEMDDEIETACRLGCTQSRPLLPSVYATTTSLQRSWVQRCHPSSPLRPNRPSSAPSRPQRALDSRTRPDSAALSNARAQRLVPEVLGHEI
jgi:hypothetical protein